MMHVLVCLAAIPGEVVSRRDLLDVVWGEVVVGDGLVALRSDEGGPLARLFGANRAMLARIDRFEEDLDERIADIIAVLTPEYLANDGNDVAYLSTDENCVGWEGKLSR